MSALITVVGEIVTAAVGWIGQFAGTIMAAGNEILLLPICLGVAGFGIGALKRLMSLR